MEELSWRPKQNVDSVENSHFHFSSKSVVFPIEAADNISFPALSGIYFFEVGCETSHIGMLGESRYLKATSCAIKWKTE